jgi:hypothetical protein
MRHLLLTITFFVAFSYCTSTRAAEDAAFDVSPTEIHLKGPFERVQMLVREKTANDRNPDYADDLTASVCYKSSAEKIIQVNHSGLVTAHGNGSAVITVVNGEKTQQIPVTVSDFDSPQIDFLKDVRPVLSKGGCAAAACHAAQHGKGGFKLSVFGYDPVADYDAIATQARGRRVSTLLPDRSLVLEKATMRMSHGGGLRLHPNSLEYQTIRDWIQKGAPKSKEPEDLVKSVEVFPKQRVDSLGFKQQLRVLATYADGSQRDVTPLALYDAIDSGVLNVKPDGLVAAVGKGQSAVMIRYEGQVAVSTFVIPYGEQAKLADWENYNFMDELAAKKFQDVGLEPSPLCEDATFIRRAFLDAIGSLPTSQQVSDFVASTEANKRMHLIDQLLGLTGDPSLDIYGDRYAAFWTLRWSDLIRNNSASLGEQGMWAMHNWMRDSFRKNLPFNQFVNEMVMAKGSIFSNGPANFFRVHGDSSALTEATSQLFMGVRLECAKCHQHPFESISQSDYYSMAAFFSRVGTKNSEEFGLFGSETVVMVRPSGEVSHPRTKVKLDPKPLFGKPTDHQLDRRIPLAHWLTSAENPFFARSVVNRYMGYLLGSGLVEPVDDMRSTNPPSNEALLDALTKDFVSQQFNLKHLLRTIMASRLYSLSSQPTHENVADERFYSHFQVKRLAAEPLLDAIDYATGVPTKFKNLPLGTRAIELPDAEYPDYFLNTFAKPRRASVCECERSPDANLAQALHTLNGDTLATKIAGKEGRIAKLIQEKKSHEDIVQELYLTALCRPPTAAELETSHEFLKESDSPEVCYQDLLWALLNSKQFLFVY